MASPVKAARKIPPSTQLQLVAAAAGRCEFLDCGEYLYEHKVSHAKGSFANDAHIVGFSKAGPRGGSKRPANIHALSNLMLLCGSCHAEIDKNWKSYSVERLREFKAAHESRMRHLTGLPVDARSHVIVLKASIDRRLTDIPFEVVSAALLPDRFPADRDGTTIDLTALDLEDARYYDLAPNEITNRLTAVIRPALDGSARRHFSVFAIGPIPILMRLGGSLPSTLRFDLFQHHRVSGGDWNWRDATKPVDFETTLVQRGTDQSHVALMLSVSGSIQRPTLPPAIDATFTIYELRPSAVEPRLGLVASRKSLEQFREAYRDVLATVRSAHLPIGGDLHVFAAVPPAAAIACGYDLLPKTDPTLLIYDHNRASGGFALKTRINSHDRS